MQQAAVSLARPCSRCGLPCSVRCIPPAALRDDAARMALCSQSQLDVEQSANRITGIFDVITRHALQFKGMSEDEPDKYAHNAAEFLWRTLGDPAHPKLVRADFEEVLESPEDANFAFEMFDVDGDGFVVEGEVHERFEAIYRC